MKLTKEQALELHRKMWTDMQKDLGDNPDAWDREKYKLEWCRRYFGTESIMNTCFLCEYADPEHTYDRPKLCADCPIDWGTNYRFIYPCEAGPTTWQCSPISEILALPER